MNILCLDASGKSAAVAVVRDGAVLAQAFENSGFTHSETLLPLVDTTLQKAGVAIENIDLFAVTNGPGSFTGLRIGAALCKGLAGDKPCVPVPTLSALAYTQVRHDGIIIPMMDARCKQTYTAAFRCADGQIERLTPDRAIAVAELEGEIEQYISEGNTVIVPGDGGYLLGECVADKVTFPDQPLISGESVYLAAQNIQPVSADRLGLEYLRLSQAEREKNQKLGGKTK